MRQNSQNPKVTLVFDAIEHKEELDSALNGAKYASILEDMDNYFRARLKYEELPEDVENALQAARDYLNSLRY